MIPPQLRLGQRPWTEPSSAGRLTPVRGEQRRSNDPEGRVVRTATSA
jgi:hypothetical protein